MSFEGWAPGVAVDTGLRLEDQIYPVSCSENSSQLRCWSQKGHTDAQALAVLEATVH